VSRGVHPWRQRNAIIGLQPSGNTMTDDQVEFQAAIQRVISSKSRRKLVVTGPGTGKTTLFRALLEASVPDPDGYLVLTFLNNLRKDLEIQLSEYAKVSTVHSYCLGLLYQRAKLRFGLSSEFRCEPPPRKWTVS
jgi:superfamily I DNA/RNA helicase